VTVYAEPLLPSAEITRNLIAKKNNNTIQVPLLRDVVKYQGSTSHQDQLKIIITLLHVCLADIIHSIQFIYVTDGTYLLVKKATQQNLFCDEIITQFTYSHITARECRQAAQFRESIKYPTIQFIQSHTYTHTQPFYCSSGIFPGPPVGAGTRKVKTRKVKPIWIYWSKR